MVLLNSWLIKTSAKRSEKREVKQRASRSVMSDSLRPHGLCTVHGILQARILEWVAVPFSRECFLLQRIFPTQGSNPGLLHCRGILYQISHQGSPKREKRYPLCEARIKHPNEDQWSLFISDFSGVSSVEISIKGCLSVVINSYLY